MPGTYHYLYEFPAAVETHGDGRVSLTWPDSTDPFQSNIAIPENDRVATIQVMKGAFSAAECQSISMIGDAQERMAGRVELGNGEAGVTAKRISHIAWIRPEPATQWLFHRLGMIFGDIAKSYGIQIAGFVDPLQYTVYNKDQHFEWHMDTGSGASSLRKISMTVQLSNDADYEGGELQFIHAPELRVNRTIGTATFFPSFMAHRVSKISRGVRRSLVAWAAGLPFR